MEYKTLVMLAQCQSSHRLTLNVILDLHNCDLLLEGQEHGEKLGLLCRLGWERGREGGMQLRGGKNTMGAVGSFTLQPATEGRNLKKIKKITHWKRMGR